MDIYDMIIEKLQSKDRLIQRRRPMWKRVQYSQNQIKKAGKMIVKDTLSKEDEKKTLDIINNWRASHAFPLNTLTIYMKRITPVNTVVVQRLKRLDSIIGKLKRFPYMSLCSMQDLGGCRVIVESVDEVYEVIKKLKSSRIRHILKEEYDYLENPKDSGYRSYHLVYKYYSENNDSYNQNMLIEIQVRTKLQHIWATAVETMGIYTKKALKSGYGDEEVLRFFCLVSSLFALKEKMPIISGTPDNWNDIVKEIKDIDKEINIISALSAISVAIDHVKERSVKGYYILILNYDTKRLSIKYFKPGDIERATGVYDKIEASKGEGIDAVLVSATSFSSLRAAYPNYFSDISEFIQIMREITK